MQGEQSKTHASSIEDVRARMLELQGSFVIVGRCQFLNTPRSAAQHFVEDSVGRDKIIDAEVRHCSYPHCGSFTELQRLQ